MHLSDILGSLTKDEKKKKSDATRQFKVPERAPQVGEQQFRIPLPIFNFKS